MRPDRCSGNFPDAKSAPTQGVCHGRWQKTCPRRTGCLSKWQSFRKLRGLLDKEASLTRAEVYIAEAAVGGAEIDRLSRGLAGGLSVLDRRLGFLSAAMGRRDASTFRDAAVLAPSEDTDRLGAAARA